MVQLETGGSALRTRYAEFLREAAIVLDRPELSRVADRYHALGEAWTTFAMASLPDRVPLLVDTRHLLTQRDRLYRLNAISEARDVQRQLDGFEAQATGGLGVNDAVVSELRHNLAGQLTAIATAEDEALALLRVASQVCV